MDTISAFRKGQESRNWPPKVFDWVKAASLIADELGNGKEVVASAGLIEDWEWTSGLIFDKGAPVPREETYTHLSSTWATPEICINGVYTECYISGHRLEEFDWNSSTYWPEEALVILSPYVVV